jgi:hypothetical protein
MSSVIADPRPTEEEVEAIDPTAFPYKFEIVPIKSMIVDAYQRPLTNFVDKIEREFDPALIGTLCLSKRSKTKYAVIDGQTRMTGMERRGLTEAPAIVYEGLSRAEEAALFSKFQTERRGMTSASRFKAQVIAGIEPQVTINAIIEEHGFFVEHNSSDPRSLKAVAALEFLYQGTYGRKGNDRTDPELLGDVLEVIKQAWPGLPDTAKGAVMLRGLGWFLAREPGGNFKSDRTSEIQMERLIAKLKNVTPSDLASRAESLREGKGMSGNAPAYLAEAIQAVYSKKGR